MIFAEVCLLTQDVPRLARFYKKVLKTTSDCDDKIHQAMITNGATLTIYNNGEVKNVKNENIVIAFTVEDVDKEFERLQQLGIKILEPPTTRPWGARNMLFTDPDGNHVVFRSFPA
jgi:predicted enzyme related to lactoylglutathione lyase